MSMGKPSCFSNKPVGHGAAHEIVAQHAVAPARHDEDGVVALVKPVAQFIPAAFRQQVASHGGHGDIRQVQVDEHAVRIARGFRIESRAGTARKQGFHVLVAQAHMLDQALLEHLRHAEFLEYLHADAGDLVRVAALRKAQFFARHFQGRGQHALVDDAHGSRGLRHAIDIGVGRVRRALGSCIDGDILFQRQALVLLDELKQRRFTEAVEKHGFVLRQHGDVEKTAFRIDGDQQIDGHAGKAGNGRQVHRFKNVADQFGRRRVLAEQGPDGQIGFLVAHDDGRRKAPCQLGLGRAHRPTPVPG